MKHRLVKGSLQMRKAVFHNIQPLIKQTRGLEFWVDVLAYNKAKDEDMIEVFFSSTRAMIRFQKAVEIR